MQKINRPALFLFLLFTLTSPFIPLQNKDIPAWEATAPEWISAKERVQLGDAQSVAGNVMKNIQHIPKLALSRFALDYTVYAEVRGISIQIECKLSIEADPDQENMYQARFDLGTVQGHGTLDRVVVSLGKVIGKVPDTKWHLRSELQIHRDTNFQSLKYWESPKERFIRTWRKILRDKRMAVAYRNRLNRAEKSAELETRITRKQARLWSPFLVEFGQGSNGNIRFKKNHIDESAVWENEQLPDKGQMDPLGAILNFMLMGWEGKNGIPIINVYRKSDMDAQGKRIPRFVFEELELIIERNPNLESGLYPPCQQTAQIKGGQGLANMFNQHLYFLSTATDSHEAEEVFNPNIVSFIYFGDIVEKNNGVPKKFAGKVRAYLTSATFVTRGTVN